MAKGGFTITLIYQSCVLAFQRIKIAFRLGKLTKERVRSITLISIGQTESHNNAMRWIVVESGGPQELDYSQEWTEICGNDISGE